MDNDETLNVVWDETKTITTDLFAKGITNECPICKKDYQQGRYIWNVDYGIIAGKIICEDCFKKLFDKGEN